MPLLWTHDGEGLDEAAVDAKNLHGLVASTHHVPGDPLAGIEVLLASGAIYALGDLYLLSGEDVFKTAAKRIVEPLVRSLRDPYNDPAAAALSYYRWTFEDTGFDDGIRSGLVDLPEASPELLALIFPQEIRRREPGIGKRADMAYWGEWSDDGSVKPASGTVNGYYDVGVSSDGGDCLRDACVAECCDASTDSETCVARGARTCRYGRCCVLGCRWTWTELGARRGHCVLRALAFRDA